MDKLKDIWNEKKKLILTITIGVVVFILIIVLIILLVKIFTRYDYASTEKMMVSATTEYLKTNKDLLPTDDMSTITVMYDTLVGGKYIKEMSKVSKDSSCSGSVDVYKNNNKYYYIPILSCDNYETKTLTDKILESEEIFTKDDGLYSLNENYVYRGEFVNNYFKFMNTTWRIIKWDDDKIYLISADTLDNKVNYVFDDRYNETVNSQKGYNTFESSRIYNSLESYYRNNFKNYEKYLQTMDSCVHSRSENDKDKTGTIECTKTFTSLISLLSTYDYMNASIDSLCNKISERNCSNYNYLSKTTNKWWLLNGTNENTYEVYSSNASGVISLDAANNKKFLRPVVAIPTHMLYKSGNGTSDSPYEIYEY